MTPPTIELDYSELMAETRLLDSNSVSPYNFIQRKVKNTDIGDFDERALTIGDVRINDIKTNFKDTCRIAVNDRYLANAMHLCLPIGGTVSGVFQDAGIAATLRPKTHHYMFVPGNEYELAFEKEVRVVHVEFGLPYFQSLLCPNERWSAELQEKFYHQQVVYSGGSLLCKHTNDVIHAIVNCPLTGNLRKIFLEAKALELVAIQLEHYRSLIEPKAPIALKKNDIALMNEVKIFLSSNLTADHSLKSIALHFGINEFKLKKNFKAQFGQTIFDYLLDIKMEHAYELLRSGEMLVNEVSREIGYKNPNHFATAFANKFGISPSKVRR